MWGGEDARGEDTPRLPVLSAFIKECLRWRPPIPTGEFLFLRREIILVITLDVGRGM